jgi:zinc transporter ZupT
MDLWTPVASSFIAGAATTIGGGVVFLLRGAPNPRHISFFLGFAAGVMIVVSVLDLWLPAAVVAPLKASFWLAIGIGGSILASALPLPEPERLLERLFVADKQATHKVLSLGDCEDARAHPLPHGHSDHTYSDAQTTPQFLFGPLARKTAAASGAEATVGSAAAARVPDPRSPALAGGRSPLRLGAIMLLVLTAHNFPEGISVMAAGVKSPSLGFIVTVAMCVHEVPPRRLQRILAE